MTSTIIPGRVVSKLDNGNKEYEKLKKRLRKSTGFVYDSRSFNVIHVSIIPREVCG